MQIDSGSSHTIISKGVVDAYKLNSWVTECNKTYTTANGTT